MRVEPPWWPKQPVFLSIFVQDDDQLMVNCWFGSRWFGSLGSPYWKGLLGLGLSPESQTTQLPSVEWSQPFLPLWGDLIGHFFTRGSGTYAQNVTGEDDFGTTDVLDRSSWGVSWENGRENPWDGGPFHNQPHIHLKSRGYLLDIFPKLLGIYTFLRVWYARIVSVVNNHGERCCPLRIGLWDHFLTWPWKWPKKNGGDPNDLVTRMILQAMPPCPLRNKSIL